MNKNELLLLLLLLFSFPREKRLYSVCVYVYFSSVVFCQLDVYDGDRVCGRNFTFLFSFFVFSNCHWRVALPPLGRCPCSINTSPTHISKKKFNIYSTSVHSYRQRTEEKKGASNAIRSCIIHPTYFIEFLLLFVFFRIFIPFVVTSCENINS